MKFTEAQLESTIIEVLGEEACPYLSGDRIELGMAEEREQSMNCSYYFRYAVEGSKKHILRHNLRYEDYDD